VKPEKARLASSSVNGCYSGGMLHCPPEHVGLSGFGLHELPAPQLYEYVCSLCTPT